MRRKWLGTISACAMVGTFGAGLVRGAGDAKSRPQTHVTAAAARAYAAAAERPHAPAGRRDPRPAIAPLLLQVALDRAGFSVGEIDGAKGSKTQKALAAFQRAKGLPPSGVADPDTRAALGPRTSATIPYRITTEDAAGPFVARIPADLEQQGSLPALGYTSIVEAIAERFHTTPRLLRRLNGRARFAAGETITVPDVEPAIYPAASERRKPDKAAAAATAAVIVSKEQNDLIVQGASGETLFYAPVSSGSEHDPLPIGEWKVTDVYLLPRFHYNPKLFWDADPSHAKTLIKPGPNNPVGVVWIDINREHYGLHGTPEPATVGVTQSHGCVRLTNWDAMRLVALVQPGTKVVFTSGSPTITGSAAHTAASPSIDELRARKLTMPVAGVRADALVPSFAQRRGAADARPHEALDIMAARGTPVVAVENGRVAKLFWSKAGGHTIYQFDPSERFAYYYAHLDRYADGLAEGQAVRRGQIIGYVGSTGNAAPDAPHLHFAITVLTPEKQWWVGTAIDPYPILRWALESSPRTS